MAKVFVYGTLLKGNYNYNQYLAGRSEYVREGFIIGSIYKLIGYNYPAFIENYRGKVHGEVYEVSDDVLKELDQLEDYHQDDEQGSMYLRKEIMIFNEDNQVVDECYVYVYNNQNPKFKDLIADKIYSGYFNMED